MYRLVFLFILILLCSGAYAVNLSEVKNDIPFSESASIGGISSGTLVISDQDSVWCYNKMLRQTRSFELQKNQKIVISDNGQFYCLITVTDSENKSNSSFCTAEIFDNRGRSKGLFNDLQEGDFYLSPDGEYIISTVCKRKYSECRVIVNYLNGTAVFLDITACKSITFAPDGNRFIIDGGNKGLNLYLKDGTIVNSFGFAQFYAFSDKGNFLVLTNLRKISIYKDEKQVGEFMVLEKSIEDIYFSEELNRLFYVAPYTLEAVDIETGKSLWNYKTESTQYRFTSIDLSPDNRFIACGVIMNMGNRIAKEERHDKGHVYLFDIDRNVMRRLEFRSAGWESGKPDVGFWPDLRTIVVESLDRILTIEMI